MYITNSIQHYEQSLIDEAIEYFRSKMPEEACGVFADDKFIPFDNKADDPLKDFVIDDPEYTELYVDDHIDCILHSHNDFPMVSYNDKLSQQEVDIPFGIINFKQKSVTHVIFFGDHLQLEPLKGRPFFYGAFDCLTLVRDYYIMKYEIELPDPPKVWGFWNENDTMFEDGLEDSAVLFKIKPKYAEEGDIILYNMNGKCIDHCGILLDNNLVFHHFINRISARYPISIARNKLVSIYRRIKND